VGLGLYISRKRHGSGFKPGVGNDVRALDEGFRCMESSLPESWGFLGYLYIILIIHFR
jgi:hypothetical protein